jgi:hypothetical protein
MLVAVAVAEIALLDLSVVSVVLAVVVQAVLTTL